MHTETSLSDSSDEESQTTTDPQPPTLPPIPDEIRLTPEEEVCDLNENHYDESFETVSSDKNAASEQQSDSLDPSGPSLSTRPTRKKKLPTYLKDYVLD